MAAKKRKDPKRVAAGKKAALTRRRNVLTRRRERVAAGKEAVRMRNLNSFPSKKKRKKKPAATRIRPFRPWTREDTIAADKAEYEERMRIWKKNNPSKKKNQAAVARNVARRERNAELRIRRENALNSMRRSLKADAYYDGD